MEEEYYYICEACKSDEESGCFLKTNTSPGLPSICPFDLGFDGAEWQMVTKESFENKWSERPQN